MVVIDMLVTVTNNIKIYSMETCGFKTVMSLTFKVRTKELNDV